MHSTIPEYTQTQFVIMRFFTLSFALSALAALAAAQSGPNSFSNPPGGYQFTPGQSTDLTWGNQKGSTVTLTLRQGSNGNLDKGTVIQGKPPLTTALAVEARMRAHG